MSTSRIELVEISAQPLDVAAHSAAAARSNAGATVLFTGVVRDHDHGRAVVELEYQGHPSAQDVLNEIVAEVVGDPLVLGCAVSHRVGSLAIGDVALVAAVSSAHRHEAFEICGRLVEQVKARLPIWKRQVFADGTDEWVNCP
jgi:molybdopterin synthase catalytic subunit